MEFPLFHFDEYLINTVITSAVRLDLWSRAGEEKEQVERDGFIYRLINYLGTDR